MSIEARYRMSRGAFELDVHLRAPESGITAIFGPSGSGKTLLLRAIAGLESADEARFQMGGETWDAGEDRRAVHKRSLGFVFQEASLFPHLNVRRNLEYALKRAETNRDSMPFERAVEMLGLAELLERDPAGLSGGERQRVAIARALLAGPRLLLMDEPLASLDEAGKADILPFLEDLHRSTHTPILYVTHSMDEVVRLADHLVLVERGSVLAAGPITDVLTDLDLPPALGPNAETVIESRVSVTADDDDLTILEFDGGQITVASKLAEIGRSVRLRVRARDVSLALERHADTSILNILEARVDRQSNLDGPQVTVRLTIGPTAILARVTRRSAERLRLEPGKKVFAQIKSVALSE